MNNQSANPYSSISRSAWIITAVLILLFCGPVKKLISLRLNTNAVVYSCLKTNDKKLKSWNREKKEIVSRSYFVSHDVPGKSFFLTGYFSDIIAISRIIATLPYKTRAVFENVRSEIPLYLYLRKLLL